MSGLAAMGNSLAKAAAVDFGVQWCCWVLAAALKTEKFYDLTGSGKTSLCVNRVEFAPSVQYFFAVFACLLVCVSVRVCVCVSARARVLCWRACVRTCVPRVLCCAVLCVSLVCVCVCVCVCMRVIVCVCPCA